MSTAAILEGERFHYSVPLPGQVSQMLKRENKVGEAGPPLLQLESRLEMYILYLQSRGLPTDRPMSNQALTGLQQP